PVGISGLPVHMSRTCLACASSRAARTSSESAPGGLQVHGQREDPDEAGRATGLAVVSVLRSELVKVPLLPALVQVVADTLELVLGPMAGQMALGGADSG